MVTVHARLVLRLILTRKPAMLALLAGSSIVKATGLASFVLHIVKLCIPEVWSVRVTRTTSGHLEMPERQHVPGLHLNQEISPIGMTLEISQIFGNF